jgi:hypothetical protein
VDRRDRVIHALSRFVFPGQFVPRGPMAAAILAALDHGDDYAEYLPARHIVWSEEMEAFDALLSLVVQKATIGPGGTRYPYNLGTERRLRAQKGATTRAKKRAVAATCPCCGRSFSQLRRHMAAKHPEALAEHGIAPDTTTEATA